MSNKVVKTSVIIDRVNMMKIIKTTTINMKESKDKPIYVLKRAGNVKEKLKQKEKAKAKNLPVCDCGRMNCHKMPKFHLPQKHKNIECKLDILINSLNYVDRNILNR